MTTGSDPGPHTSRPPTDPPPYRPPDVQPPGPPYPPPAGYIPQPQTNVKAILALVFGIMGVLALPFVGSIVAVVLGHIARKEIAGDPTQTGDGLAVAGLVMGWVMLGILALVLAIVVFVMVVAVIVFLIILLVHIIENGEEGDRPGFPWPAMQDQNGRPLLAPV